MFPILFLCSFVFIAGRILKIMNSSQTLRDLYAVSCHVGDIAMCLDQYETKWFDDAYKMMLEVSSTGDGFSKEECDEKEFRKRMADKGTFIMIKQDTDELVAISGLNPSALCRSIDSMCCASFYIVRKDFRRKGVTKHLTMMFVKLFSHLGYIGKLYL